MLFEQAHTLKIRFLKTL